MLTYLCSATAGWMKLISRRQRASSLPLMSFAEVMSYQKVPSARFNFSSSKNPSGFFELHFIMIGGLDTNCCLWSVSGLQYFLSYPVRQKKKHIKDEGQSFLVHLCVRATVRERKPDQTDSCLRAHLCRFLITNEVRHHRNTEIPAHNQKDFW